MLHFLNRTFIERYPCYLKLLKNFVFIDFDKKQQRVEEHPHYSHVIPDDLIDIHKFRKDIWQEVQTNNSFHHRYHPNSMYLIDKHQNRIYSHALGRIEL